jgi:hypothetical protein
MGSSGGNSGKIDFPDHMKIYHKKILDHTGVDEPVVSVTDAFNYAAGGNSPYLAYITNPDPVADAFFTGGQSVDDYARIFNLLKTFQEFDTATDYAARTAGLDSASLITKIGNSIDDDITLNVLPKFKASLRSMGAVMSSAFIIGEALIWDSKEKALAKECIEIEKLSLMVKDQAWKQTIALVEYKKSIVTISSDATKMFYALKTDLDDHYSMMHEKDLKWDLDLFQYVNNTLASINGAAHPVGGGKGGSKVGSALSGALSMAATGASMGGAPGAGIGGLLGLAGGLFG